MSERWERMRPPVLTGVGVMAACVMVYAVDPAEPGHYPPCPTKLLTGLDCPFCGSMRATHQLLHGHVGAALDLNAMTVLIVFPLAIALFVLWCYRSWRGEPLNIQIPRWVTATAIALMMVYTVVRNVPGMPLGTAT